MYKTWYDAHCSVKTAPYPGIIPLMRRLRENGIPAAIISNKPDTAVRELADQFFPGLVESAVGESALVRRKPDPDAVLAAVQALGLPLSDCVYVGDSEVDILTARNAGLDCISVCWGFRDEDQLLASDATILVRSAEELQSLLLS